MALYYLDTSALVKLYVRERGTDRLLRLASKADGHRFAILALARVEFHSAIRRRQRLADIDDAAATELIERFERHLETRFIRQVITDNVLDTAVGFVQRYPLRAYDAVQLAGCAVLKMSSGGQDPIFVCADNRLLHAAESEGLEVLDASV